MAQPVCKPKVALYLRVSTDDQDTKIQRSDLEAFCNAQGWPIVHIFEDKGFTGSNMKRPALERLLSTVIPIDIVLVWKFDRFARSLNELLQMLKHLESRGIKFMSLKDSVDLTTPQGRFMMQILGAFAEFEASMIRERVRAGMKHAQKHGTSTGNPIGRKRTIPEWTRKKIVEHYNSGNSVVIIASQYNISKMATYKILTKALGPLNNYGPDKKGKRKAV